MSHDTSGLEPNSNQDKESFEQYYQKVCTGIQSTMIEYPSALQRSELSEGGYKLSYETNTSHVAAMQDLRIAGFYDDDDKPTKYQVEFLKASGRPESKYVFDLTDNTVRYKTYVRKTESNSDIFPTWLDTQLSYVNENDSWALLELSQFATLAPKEVDHSKVVSKDNNKALSFFRRATGRRK